VCKNKLNVSKLHTQADDFNLIHFLLEHLTVQCFIHNALCHQVQQWASKWEQLQDISKMNSRTEQQRLKDLEYNHTSHISATQSHLPTELLGSRRSHYPPKSPASLMGVQ
jgi:hypothetical protein